MAINYSRKVESVRNMSLSDIFPSDSFHGSFAAFGVDSGLRCDVGIQAADAYIGRVGVILIHNDGAFSNRLRRQTALHPGVNFINVNSSDKNYDPLYGMDESAVLDAVAPKDTYNSLENDIVRGYLGQYLAIMRYEFSRNPHMFGSYPYNLNLLSQLTRMSYMKLSQSVLNYMPEQTNSNILSHDNATKDADSKVVGLGSVLNKYIWKPGNAANHSRISITDSCLNRNVISVYVQNSSKELLDYLSVEINYLISRNTNFLLLESGIDLNKSQNFRSLFFNINSSPSYHSGIIASSMSSVSESKEKADAVSALIASCRNVIVLPLSDAEAATPFSNVTDTYYESYQNSDSGKARQPFHFFSVKNQASHEVKVEHHSVQPNELTGKYDAVLWTKASESYQQNRVITPILINRLTMN